MKRYKGRDGNTYYKPAWSALEAALETGTEGFCLACGQSQDGVEPDAKRYTCESCGKPNVYGAENLLVRNLFHVDKREPQEDSPHIEDGRDNCNDAATEEGRYHGRI